MRTKFFKFCIHLESGQVYFYFFFLSLQLAKFNCSSKKESEMLKKSHVGQIQVQFVFFKVSYWDSVMKEHPLWTNISQLSHWTALWAFRTAPLHNPQSALQFVQYQDPFPDSNFNSSLCPSLAHDAWKGFIQKLKKGGGRWGKIFFMWFVIGLFETLICAIAEDEVCDSCIVSPWALLIFLLCLWWPNSNFLCCVIMQNGESRRDLLLSLTNWKALAPGGHSSPEPPFKTLITLLPVTFSQLDPQLGVVWGKRFVLWQVTI